MEITEVEKKPFFDESIEGIEYHSHFPYSATKLQPGDEVRVSVQHQDIYTLPCQSYIYIEGKFVQEDGTQCSNDFKLTNNVAGFLFDEIRYELCGVEIDRVRNPGITTTLKGLASYRSDNLEFMGWTWGDKLNITSPEGCFSLCVPLSHFLGFAEDYQKVIINVKQELVFIRSRKDDNCYTETGNKKGKIELTKLCWKLPYVTVNEYRKLSLLRHLKGGKILTVGFRSWELYEYPLLPTTQRQVWSVKTSTQMEKPRYIILTFSTKRMGVINKDSSKFDHCHLVNVKAYLNSKSYPYDDLHIDYEKCFYALPYQMFLDFKKSYYPDTDPLALISYYDFKHRYPMVVIDCSKQSESIKSGPVDIRLEFEANKPFPRDTTAYCTIIHDSMIEYNPLTSVLRRVV